MPLTTEKEVSLVIYYYSLTMTLSINHRDKYRRNSYEHSTFDHLRNQEIYQDFQTLATQPIRIMNWVFIVDTFQTEKYESINTTGVNIFI